ncbi:MAG: 3-oxo-tetronate kinase [Pseudomonadota bacterium]
MFLGCIADDFTGATDLANVLSRGGMSCVQLNGLPALNPRNAELVRSADGVVVALKSRSIPPGEAVAQSLQALEWLTAQGCGRFFFKYCSTFDSTDEGNIGPVAEALLAALGEDFSIACPAAPENGRTVYQGHLFVNGVLLSETGMRNHPITPMTDPNLVRVLGRQSKGEVGLIDFAAVSEGADAVRDEIKRLRDGGKRLAVADAVLESHLETIVNGGAGLRLLTGGSGLAVGLPALLMGAAASAAKRKAIAWPESVKSAVISGSCSEATNAQVVAMQEIRPSRRLDPVALMEDAEREVSEASQFALRHAEDGPGLIYSTARPDELQAVQAKLGQERASELIENAMGSIAQRLADGGITRLVVAGGETSGAVVSALGLEALAIGPEIDPGVPWTLALGERPVAVALKSGNFGGPDFFTKAFNVLDNEMAAS